MTVETPEDIANEIYEGDERIVEVAKTRFQRCHDWEGTAQARWLFWCCSGCPA